LGGLILVTAAQLTGLYQSWRGRPLLTSAGLLLKAWLITWAALIILAFTLKESETFSRLALILWAILTPIILVIFRLIIRQFLARMRIKGYNHKRVAILGAGLVGKQLAQTFRQSPWLGYDVVGFYDDKTDLQGQIIDQYPVIGTLEDTYQAAKNNQIDEVYICLPLRAEAKIKDLLNQLTDTTLVVKFVPDLFTFDLMHSKWTDLKGIPVVSVFDTPLSSTSAKLLKRLEDIVFSSIILVLISPIMAILAIGVKLTSPGPVFYRQTRVGWNGQNFGMLKFRSMPVDVEKEGVKWGSATSKTNTKFGQFIRATSLDELPQFLNVLKGDMSIVGPRPERDIFVEQFRNEIPRYMQKHMVKAGITGWAQIHGWRGDTCLEKRVEYDLHYINNWSLWLDVKIIILTIFKGFINKNAR
jgi:putative colanic acid biosynthesis UDP-glucose lipid carrier transferase